ncbi:MAG: GNAT family N-acetyltransferase [Hyphomicrobiaceae bacterium]|nr:MAG: GNAT family N-acetyltransferase [Hyphomicrobiaceae bacterium]
MPDRHAAVDQLEFRHANSRTEIAACYPVMRELRPRLTGEKEFVERIERQMAAGYRLLAAWDGPRAIGLAGYRPEENLIYGSFIYVDDLVVVGAGRSKGIGGRLLDGVSNECRRLDIPMLVLDTAIDNSLGQRFYFRHGMLARGLRFSKRVS